MNEYIIATLQGSLNAIKAEHGYKPKVTEKISDMMDLLDQIPIDPEQIMDVFYDMLLAIELVDLPNRGQEQDAYVPVQTLVMKNADTMMMQILIKKLDPEFDCGCG
ncbi:hypothetical protein [Domibacillus epiphyticus]|uniref:Uncharacterized protein n=1 Tax=Domibacillus epiphyticus TaxID=1714355 RepID=A0A1V2ABF5_9BACI|nr:hypothetical protein [Domibacillus epiphyticus]OMP68333.1 hypothetical protein BTO28_02375 [Domibacillus epiphyticus]